MQIGCQKQEERDGISKVANFETAAGLKHILKQFNKRLTKLEDLCEKKLLNDKACSPAASS